MNIYLKEQFETGEFLCFALNEDGCIHLAMFAKDYEGDEDAFRVDYANKWNKECGLSILKITPQRLIVEDINIYYQDGEFVTNHHGGGCIIEDSAVLVDSYFAVEEG